jgi:hypothetical protein
MKYTYSGRPIENNIKDLPRVPSKGSLHDSIMFNRLLLLSLVCTLGAILWLGIR